MKKITGIFLALGLTLTLAACGQSDTNNDEAENNAGGANSNEEETSNENNVDNENNEVNNNNSEGNEQDESLNNDLNENANENTNENETEEAANEEMNTTDDVDMIDSVTLYFPDDQGLEMYRVASDVSVSSDEAGAMEAMNLLIAGPTHDELHALIPENARVDSIEFQDNVAYVSFSDELLEANLGSSGELMLTEQVALMMEQFGYDQTKILIGDEEVPNFLGHMDISEPIQAENPEDYQWFE
ncbi:GerMN domain-containing protein [Salipaludibacillus sp. HK11]|uniref:GerMN domain-containing protein n=1 Tax=Salipaludibacillus sp. HK11 TaxID=3394320 RepID=UPI0039FC6602